MSSSQNFPIISQRLRDYRISASSIISKHIIKSRKFLFKRFFKNYEKGMSTNGTVVIVVVLIIVIVILKLCACSLGINLNNQSRGNSNGLVIITEEYFIYKYGTNTSKIC